MAGVPGVYKKIKKQYVMARKADDKGNAVAILECNHAVLAYISRIEANKSRGFMCSICTAEEEAKGTKRAAKSSEGASADAMNRMAEAMELMAKKISQYEDRITELEEVKTSPKPEEEPNGQNES
jgi:hypothetical protein